MKDLPGRIGFIIIDALYHDRKHPDLHAYQLGKEFFCEKQYWDAFIHDLCVGGGTVTMN